MNKKYKRPTLAVMPDGTTKPISPVGRTGKRPFTDEEKIQVISVYLATNSVKLTSETTGVTEQTIIAWKKSAWWDKMVTDIYHRDAQSKASKMSRSVNKALDLVQERLENGDYMYDPRTGEIKRVPVKLAELIKATNSLVSNQQLLERKTESAVKEVEQTDKLTELANKFAAFASAKNKRETVTIEDAVIVSDTGEN